MGRPQIIHVARPVLVDRPVPIQQRPLVIERDRPVPVRVETIERTEAGAFDCPEVGQKEGVTETTFHEFSQNSFQKSPSTGDLNQDTSSNFNYNTEDNEQTNKNKQLVLDLLEEADRRKKSLESKSNDSFVNNSASSKNLESMPYNSGYTLEVLDQRVSDKFEKVDQETIKARYGVDSFQYLPTGSESVNNDYQQPILRSSGGSYKSLASGNENVSNTSAYGNYVSVSGGADTSASHAQNYQISNSNGNLSSILTDLAKMTTANK